MWSFCPGVTSDADCFTFKFLHLYNAQDGLKVDIISALELEFYPVIGSAQAQPSQAWWRFLTSLQEDCFGSLQLKI